MKITSEKRAKGNRDTMAPEEHCKRQETNLQFAMIVYSVLVGLINGVVDFHDCRLVATSVTVVGCGKDRDHHSAMLPLIAFHDKLVCSCDKVKSIDMCKLFGDVLSKCISSAPWRDAPSAAVYTKRWVVMKGPYSEYEMCE